MERILQSELYDYFGTPSRNASQNPWLTWIDLAAFQGELAHVKLFHTRQGFGFWGHELFNEELLKVFSILSEKGLLSEIKTFDGCWNVRKMKSGSSLSIHSWGLALDFNAADNGYGSDTYTWSDEFVQVWADCGWEWGGIWDTMDPMHFQLVHTRDWSEYEDFPFKPKSV